MSLNVFIQIAHLRKLLSTFIKEWANKWFFSCMKSQMIIEIVPLSKMLLTAIVVTFHYDQISKSSWIFVPKYSKSSARWNLMLSHFFAESRIIDKFL